MALETLTQALRDEIIQDIKDLNIPDFQDSYVRKFGAFPQSRCAVLVNVDDEMEPQNITDAIRLMVCTIVVCVAITQDREGDYLDHVSSYIEDYVRTPRSFLPHAGYEQCRVQQMVGRSRRSDVYGQDGWFVNEFEFVLPYRKSDVSPSASV